MQINKKAGYFLAGAVLLDITSTGGMATLVTMGLPALATSLEKVGSSVLAGVVTNYLTNDKETDALQQLHQVIQKSFEQSIASIKEIFIQENDLQTPWWEKIQIETGFKIPDHDSNLVLVNGLDGYFFQPLIQALNDEQLIHKITHEYKGETCEQVFLQAIKAQNIDLPTFAKEYEDQLIQGITKHFATQFREIFSQQVVQNEVARKVYQVTLLQSMLTYLKYLSETLNETNIEVNNIKEHLRQLLDIALFYQVELEEWKQELQAYQQKITTKYDELHQTFQQQFDINLEFYTEKNTNAQFQLNYLNLYSDFQGRFKELMQLHRFLDEEARFLFFAVSGAGGAGKSRLANELCQRANVMGWKSGFSHIEFNEQFNWDTFSPSLDTLIVFDYVKQRKEEVAKILKILSALERQGKLVGKLRVLLLEREFDKDLSKSLFTDHNAHVTYKDPSNNGSSILELKSLEEEARWEIIQQVVKSGTDDATQHELLSNKTDILIALDEQDPLKRPLFTLMTAIALKEGQDITTWNRNKNLKYQYERLERFWAQNPLWQKEEYQDALKHLFWLATIAEYIKEEELNAIFKNNFFEELRKEVKRSQFLQQLRDFFQIQSPAHTDKVLYGLKPDLFAEFFIVQHLQEIRNNFILKDTTHELYTIAWKMRPERVWWMSFLTLSYYENELVDYTKWLEENTNYNHQEILFFYMALLYQNQGRYEEAEKYYLLAIRNGHVEAMNNLALLYDNQEKYGEAEEYYLMAIQKGDVGAMNNLAYLYQNQEKYGEAEEYYLMAIQKGLIEAMNNLANLYQNQERYEEAEKYYLLAVQKGLVGAMYNLALLYQNQEKYGEAEEYYLVAIQKGHVGAMYNLALLYDNQEKYGEAEKYYLMAIQKGHVEAMNNLALLYQNQEKYKEAEEYYLMAIQKGDVKVMNNLALLYQNQERYEEAEEYYLMAIQKGLIEAMNNLANLYKNQERYEEAEKYYLLAVQKGHVEAMNNLALLYQNQEKYGEAEEYYLMAIQKRLIEAMNNLANLYKNQERYEEAEKYYLKAIQKGLVGAMYNLALLYQNQEKYGEAEEYYLMAIQKGHVGAMNNLAYLYQNQEKYGEAEEYYLMAIQKGHVEAMDNLAYLYQNQEKYGEAEEYYLKAIQKGNVSAMNNLAYLYQNQEKYGEAEEYYLMAIQKGDVKAMNNLAYLYQNQEKYGEAEKYYLKAIQKGLVGAMYNLAYLYQNQEKYGEAEEYYLKAIQKGNVGAMYNLAYLYQNQEKYGEAEEYYLMGIQNGDVGAMYNLALLYQNQEKYEGAEEYYLLAIKNGLVNAMYNLALLYENQERYKEAEEYYLLAIKNGDISAMYNLALLYQNQERYKEAEEYYLLAIKNGLVNAMYNLALLYQNQERYKEAEEYYLLAIKNGHVNAINNLALLYENQERYKEAEKYYLLAIKNGHVEAYLGLSLLYYSTNQKKEIAYQLSIQYLQEKRSQLSAKDLMLKNIFDAWLQHSDFTKERAQIFDSLILHQPDLLSHYIFEILIHDNSDFLLQTFEVGNHAERLQEEFTFLYWVILHFLRPEDPQIQKIPQESMNDFEAIVQQIQTQRAFYNSGE